MSGKYIRLILICFVLTGLLYLVSTIDGRSPQKSERPTLVAELALKDVSKISIQQGEAAIELALEANNWVIRSRDNFPADRARINSLLLKLASLDASQRLPGGEDSFAELGLDDTSVTNGETVKLVLSTSAASAELYLGKLRKTASGVNPLAGQGQYVRRSNLAQPLLVPQPMTVSPEISNWIQSTITNVLSDEVVRVRQYAPQGVSPEHLLYTLTVVNNQFILEKGAPAGKEFNTGNLDLVRGALENLRLLDVQAVSDERIEKLQPSFITEVGLRTGLVYTVYSYTSGEQYFLKMAVRFDAELYKLYNASKQPAADTEKPKSDAQAPKTQADYEQEVAPLNARLEGWLYEVEEYLGKKFEMKEPDFLQVVGSVPSE